MIIKVFEKIKNIIFNNNYKFFYLCDNKNKENYFKLKSEIMA